MALDSSVMCIYNIYTNGGAGCNIKSWPSEAARCDCPKGGRTADARRVLKEIEARQGERESRVPLAVCDIGLGERAAALDALDAAVRNHEISLLTSFSLLLDRVWDPLRGDPRWEGILRAAGLGDYLAAARKP
jgi:hypothetical protein